MIEEYLRTLLMAAKTARQWAGELGEARFTSSGYDIQPFEERWAEMFLGTDGPDEEMEFLRIIPKEPDGPLWTELRKRFGDGKPIPFTSPQTHEVMLKYDRKEFPAVGRIFVTLDSAPGSSSARVLRLVLRRDPR